MTLRFIIDQVTSATGGFVLGILTAAWGISVWKWWHPQTIRFWGTWSTNPHFLVASGMALVATWLAFVLKP